MSLRDINCMFSFCCWLLTLSIVATVLCFSMPRCEVTFRIWPYPLFIMSLAVAIQMTILSLVPSCFALCGWFRSVSSSSIAVLSHAISRHGCSFYIPYQLYKCLALLWVSLMIGFISALQVRRRISIVYHWLNLMSCLEDATKSRCM